METTLYLGDCLEKMKDIPDGSVDLVLADVPYGTTACKWDTVIPFEPMWEQIWRVLKPNGACVLFGSEPFSSHLRMSQIKYFKYDWVWEKNRGSNFAVLKYQPMKEHENVMVFSRRTHFYSPIKEQRKGSGLNRVSYGFMPSNTGRRDVLGNLELSKEKTKYKQEELRYPSSIQKFNCEVGHHPTQKPVALMEYLIKTYTNEGQTVLDFTMGSGTTGVACVNTGRNFIGIEKEENYFEIAEKRIAEALISKEEEAS